MRAYSGPAYRQEKTPDFFWIERARVSADMGRKATKRGEGARELLPRWQSGADNAT
jgi:hypothetical protein